MTLTTMPPPAPRSDGSGGPDFNTRHPDWQRMAGRWTMAWAFLRGGVHILDPDYDVYTARWPVRERSTTAAGETAAERQNHQSDFQWKTTSVRSFLWRHVFEQPEEFADRSRRLFHLPYFRSVINVYVAGILKQAPIRDELSEAWQAWHRDVDGRGTNIDTFMRRALTQALGWGRVHAIVDRLPTDAAPTNAEEAAKVPPPYCYLVSPIDIVDWKFGEDGLFDWVVIRENEPDVRRPGFAPAATRNRYRVWTRKTVQLWSQPDPNSAVFVGDGERLHGHDRVPMATLWCTEEDRERVMGCESPFADALDFNRHQLNKFSELDETERLQTFSILAWPLTDGGTLGEMEIGPNRAVGYDSAAGTPSYVNPDGTLPDGKWKRIEGQLQMGRTLEGASRGRAEYSKEERSAASITVESEDKRNRMTWWAAAGQAFDRELHEIMAVDLGEDAPNEAAWAKDFDFRAVSAQIADINQLKAAGLPKKTIFILARGPAQKILRENGVSTEKVAEALAEIDAEAEKPDTAPANTNATGGAPAPGIENRDRESSSDEGDAQ